MTGIFNQYMSKNRSAAVGFIFVTLLIDVIGFGIIIPVMPKLLAEIKHISINEASKYGGYLLFAFAVAQFLFSPIMGSLSDRFGRRPVLLFSLLGFGIDYLILAFAPTYGWLVIGRILAGITGASFTTASAYIADVSDDTNRAKNFGMIGAAFGLGFILGPFLGGILGQYGTRWPFYAAAALSFVNLIYGYFILPESLAPENRRPFNFKKATPFITLKELLGYKVIAPLLIAFVCLHMGAHAVQSTWNYFTMFRFSWSESMVGYSLAVVGIIVAIVQTMLAQRAAQTFGNSKSIVLGFGLYAIGMFCFAFATQSWMMFAFLIPYSLGGIAMPNLQSFLVSKVGVDQQGKLQGGLTSLMSLTTIFGPLLMTNTFYYFTTPQAPFYFPGAAFFLGGIFMTLSFLIVLFKM